MIKSDKTVFGGFKQKSIAFTITIMV